MPVKMKIWGHADLELAGRRDLTDGKSIGRQVRGQELLPALPADLDGRHSSEEATRCHLFTENSVGARHSLSHMGSTLRMSDFSVEGECVTALWLHPVAVREVPRRLPPPLKFVLSA